MQEGKVRLYYAMFITSILIFMSASILIITNYVENDITMTKLIASIGLIMIVPFLRAHYYKVLLDDLFHYQTVSAQVVNKIYRLEIISIIFLVIMVLQIMVMENKTSIYMNVTLALIIIRISYYIIAMSMKNEYYNYKVLNNK